MTRPTILVIDDSLTARMKLKETLEGDGATVLLAEDAEKGNVLALAHRPDAIVLDVVLPDMNGIDLCQQWRTNTLLKNTPILLVSGERSGQDDRAAGLRAGALGFVTKPFSTPELLAQVGMLVRLNETMCRMRKATDVADAANQAKSEFLAKMSHELRTPLNSIIGFTEMMIDDAKDPPQGKRSRRLEKVHRNSKNLLALINDILDISKIDADRLTLSRDEVDVRAVVQECVESIGPLVKHELVDVRFSIDKTLPIGYRWTGDAIRLGQIVTNLLGNAAKFTESGHIELRVKIDSGFLVIEVEDTGIGISADHLPKVFDEFEQVDSSSTRRAGGTGLGLAICRKLCTQMGGRIAAASDLGVGSCFTVTLPVQEPAMPALDSDPRRKEISTVLYVGNGIEASRVATAATTSVPRIEILSDVAQAIDRCQKREPVMTWIDPFWPDALRFLSDLKTRGSTTGIPFGLLGVRQDRCAFLSFDDCLAPPLGKDTMRDIVYGGRDMSGHRRVLVVESKVPSDYVCDMLMEFPDVETTQVTAGGQALETLDARRFDAVLSDITNEDARACELVHHLRFNPLVARPRLVALIPREPTPSSITAFQKGFSRFLAQHGEPIDQVVIRSLAGVASLIDSRQLQGVMA